MFRVPNFSAEIGIRLHRLGFRRIQIFHDAIAAVPPPDKIHFAATVAAERKPAASGIICRLHGFLTNGTQLRTNHDEISQVSVRGLVWPETGQIETGGMPDSILNRGRR